MKIPIILLCLVLALSGCASPAREGRSVVSLKPDASSVAKPVAETRKAVAAAAANVTTAQAATATAKALASKTAESKALAAELDKIEFTLATTQNDLTAALKAVTESERAVSVLEKQIDQQTAELSQLVVDYNGLAAEKRQAEVKAAENNLRKKLWRSAALALLGTTIVAFAALYIVIKKPFLL